MRIMLGTTRSACQCLNFNVTHYTSKQMWLSLGVMCMKY